MSGSARVDRDARESTGKGLLDGNTGPRYAFILNVLVHTPSRRGTKKADKVSLAEMK